MEIAKKRRGRPRKEKNTTEWPQFARDGMTMAAFDEARGRGEKHSVAVKYGADVVKQRNPGMSTSETQVKRALATYRPPGSQIVLLFERSIPNEVDLERRRLFRERLATVPVNENLHVKESLNQDPTGSVAVFRIRFGKKPDYPRSNCKKPQQDSAR
jgi:hypothetical protein